MGVGAMVRYAGDRCVADTQLKAHHVALWRHFNPTRVVVCACAYCGGFHSEKRCPNCGAPRETDNGKA